MSRLNRPESVMPCRSRLLALPLVLLCALAYLGSAAHFFLVQHRTCLEHGELLHEAEVEQGDASAQVRVSFADERLTRADARASVPHGVDAHCSHVFLRRVAPPPVGMMLSLEAPVLSGAMLEAHSVTWEPPLAWLHVAPKSSPPRA